MKSLTSLETASGVLAIALLIGLCNMPYGYYTLLRICIMVVMICHAYTFYQQKKTSLAVVACTIALLFQPFFKMVLDKGVWHIVDVVVAVLLIVYIVYNHVKKS